MDKAAKLRLKQYLEDNIPFYELKAVGFWKKGTRKTDYEIIAARVCWFFGIKSIYDYTRIGDRCSGLLTVADRSYPAGLKISHSIVVRPKVDVTQPINWGDYILQFDQTDLVSKDQFLN